MQRRSHCRLRRRRAGTILFAGGSWAAIDRGNACVALTRAVRIAAKGKVQATAGFTFAPDRRRWGEFHARLSHLPRAGSTVILTVGDQPFLLVARGGWAWSRGPLQEQAIIAAARNAGGMRVEGRDLGGGRFADRYDSARRADRNRRRRRALLRPWALANSSHIN